MSIIASLFAGPLLGVFGSLISGVMGYFERQQQMEADKAKFAHETNLLKLQVQARGQELESEEEIAAIAADTEALKGSYQHDASYGESGPIISGMLRLVRPALTFALIAIVAVLVLLDDTQLDRTQLSLKVVVMMEVAIAWWFADRRRARK